MQHAATETYKTQAIMTASPAKLVAMCYDRTILALNDAIRAIDAGDVQARFDHTTRAANIISHLWSTLDLDKGAEIAQNLSSIYRFAMNRINDVNLENSKQAAQDVVRLLEPLRQSWTELAKQGEGANAVAAAAEAGAKAAVAPGGAPRRHVAPRPGPVQGAGVSISA